MSARRGSRGWPAKTPAAPAASACTVTFAVFVVSLAPAARGDVPLPPWIDESDVPPPAWAQSVTRRPEDSAMFGGPDETAPAGASRGAGDSAGLVLYAEPSRASGRRGVSAPEATLPFFGTRRGSGCTGPWWLVGPLAWTCSDDAVLSAQAPAAPPRMRDAAGLSSQYMFVRTGGASAYASLESAEDGEADEELEGGWAVATVGTRAARQPNTGGSSTRWVRTTKGLWIAADDVSPARPSLFQGERVDDGRLDFAWVLSDRANVWPSPSPAAKGKAKGTDKAKPGDFRVRFQLVRLRAAGEGGAAASAPAPPASPASAPASAMVETADGAWMLASDLARPTPAAPPTGVLGADEHWIDVDTVSQTLVAYEGRRPVYATLVSTGLASRGPGDATPLGTHRIWVKLLATDMGNTKNKDQDASQDPRYSLEDVPYVQFFDDAVGLHGTYWHGDFGHPRSHGCVNLSPLDARWMFDFTAPHLPAGWAAAYPTPVEPGTMVRVR